MFNIIVGNNSLCAPSPPYLAKHSSCGPLGCDKISFFAFLSLLDPGALDHRKKHQETTPYSTL